MKSLRAVVMNPLCWSLLVPVAAFGLVKAGILPISRTGILTYALGLTIPGFIAGCLLPVPVSGWRTLLLLILPIAGLDLAYRFC